MLRVYCDFNDSTEDDLYWILWYEKKPLQDQIEALGLKDGDRVILYQDEDDFDVQANLVFNKTHPFFLGERLCAKADFKTLRRFPQ